MGKRCIPPVLLLKGQECVTIFSVLFLSLVYPISTTHYFVWSHFYTTVVFTQYYVALLLLFSNLHTVTAAHERENGLNYLQTAIVWIVSITLLHHTNVQIHLSRVNLNSSYTSGEMSQRYYIRLES